MFREAYASDPDIIVGTVDVSSEVLSKRAVGSNTEFRVFVAVSFNLTDRTTGDTFPGGETMDHALLARSVSDSTDLLTVISERNLGTSTAPVESAPEFDSNEMAGDYRDYNMTGPGGFTYSGREQN